MDGNDVTGFAEAARAAAFAVVEENAGKETCSVMMAGERGPIHCFQGATSPLGTKGKASIAKSMAHRAFPFRIPWS